MTAPPDIVLASASPRRSELLARLGIRFSIEPSHVCEEILPDEPPAEHVVRLSLDKAREVAQRTSVPGRWFIGSDTIVLRDDTILGKPRDVLDAAEMLRSLAGRHHQVLSGYAVYDRQSDAFVSGVVATTVRFKELTEQEIAGYIATGEPVDKAGAYAIQGIGAFMVLGIEGSYTNVVGLPLCEVVEVLEQLGAVRLFENPLYGRVSDPPLQPQHQQFPMTIKDNLEHVGSQIAAACARSGRDPSAVRLVAVSKTHPAALVEEAAAAGHHLFGESYVQEFVAKAEAVKAPVEWHFIGALQSNKIKYLRGRVSLIHSVDRLSLAAEIDRQWGKLKRTADVLLQVNLGGEESKSGAEETGLKELVRQVAVLEHVRICGLMTLPPYFDEPEEVRPYFRRLRELAGEIDALDLPGVKMAELSMGMSHDFAVAIEEGATLVRVGTAIFGAREYPQ